MKIKEFFEKHKNAAVAFSGGVDSAVLLFFAKKYAEKVKAYYVKTQFQPQFELDDAKEIAELLGVEFEIIELDVLSDKTVASNPKDRCYFCKKIIFETIKSRAEKDGFEAVLDGTNASDDADDRPGMKALEELGVLSPLRSCGYKKADIRRIARENNLPVADKPSYACLATRIPPLTEITEDKLSTTEKAEALLRNEGFTDFRIRYIDGSAKLELCRNDFSLLFEKRKKVVNLLKPYYKSVFLDLKERENE